MSKLGCALAVAVLGGGGASGNLETVLQDDALMLHRPEAQVRTTTEQIAGLGADRLRITAGWATVSPAPHARQVPGAPFDPADPATYDQERWRALDTAVVAARDAGLKVQLDIAFFAPRWAVARGSANRDRERILPDPELFGDFAAAVTRRYSGVFADPARPGRHLPAVRQFTTWNEPNHPTFLAPQWVDEGDGPRPYSPHHYRAMHNEAYQAIKRVNPFNRVLIGNTASRGSTEDGRGGVPPLRFVREMACVDERLEPLDVPECENFEPLRADGFAHHPYSRTTTPGTSSPQRDMAPIADTDRLVTLLEDLHREGRTERRWDVWFTEYGYETRPPDPFQLYTPQQQARFIGWSTWLAWQQPGVRSHAQFLLRDIDAAESGRKPGTRGYWRDFQMGLFTHDGQAKPAAEAFKLPFFVTEREVDGQRVTVLFGGVRPGRGPHVVGVEAIDPQTGRWTPVGTLGPRCDSNGPAFLTGRDGFFERTAPAGQARTYRLARLLDGVWEYGPPVELAG